ncbi:hypothetical protein MTR_2g067680 [Medicago truncatula]|uniref:OTU domain-containing protein n=1 Tax=Medicago truncatula TaxID=3880 RepID=A0A072VJK5_MEDTR|nr:hypothetical protein MTR_2g067680 [Medicago truncatula]
MKLEVKEGLRQLTFPETTMMSPPPRKVPTKGAKKKVDIARSKGKITSLVGSLLRGRKKGARLGKTSLNPLPPPTRYPKLKAIPVMRPIDYMPRFMLPFIEKVVDVIGDEHCGFRAIAEFMGLTEKIHLMIRTHLIQELKDHGDDYVEVVLTNLEVGNSESFFPLRGPPPPGNQKTPILCLGAIPNHFVLIYLKNDCPLPPSSTEWHNHKKEDVVTWEDEYLDQHELFRKLMAIESGNKPPKPQNESNKPVPILLDTPEKPKQQFEVIAEDEEDSMSLDLLQSLGL